MSIATSEKRIETIEAQLTPKEWAIRFVDGIRKYPSLADFSRADIKGGVLFCQKAQRMLIKQGEARFPEKKQLREQKIEVKRLSSEYAMLKHLVFTVNMAIGTRNDKAKAEFAMYQLALQGISLQDAFTEAAEKAYEWIVGQRGHGGAGESQRAVLDELEACHADAEATTYPFIAGLGAETVLLLPFDLICHKAAVGILTESYFEGHGILSREIEEELNSHITAIDDLISQHNEKLTVRGRDGNWLRIDKEIMPATAESARALADTWIQVARDAAIIDILSWMQEYAERESYRRQVVRRMLGVAE
ncbi:MAG: hypothetical protein WCS52_17525 [bacterium]